MGHPTGTQDPRRFGMRHSLRLLMPIVGVCAALAAISILYFSYDIVKDRMSPCEGIFRQTALNLSTHIKFLKADGELHIGKEAVTELDERAQIVALDLKTCCTVLDAGRIDPEQFLQCKANARTYDAKLQNIVTLVGATPAVAAQGASLAIPSSQPSTNALATPTPDTIAGGVEAARAASRAFNEQVVQVSKEQALRTLEAVPPSHAEISAQEREPNDDALNANIVELDKWITASIGSPKDSDYFTFTTPETYRDWIRVEVQNRSTTLEPRLELFNSEKSSLGSVYNTTPGADLVYAFVAPPKTTYTVRASNYYSQSVGVYLLRVVATKSYDTYEPNDDILSAKPIAEGVPIKAQIMDKNDVDYYAIAVPSDAGTIAIAVANKSTSLHPLITVFDIGKTQIASQYNTTSGGDATVTVKAQPGTLYVRVSDYYTDGSGDYILTVTKQ